MQKECTLPAARVAAPAKCSYQEAIASTLAAKRAALGAALAALACHADALAEVATMLVQTLQTGHKVLVAGNGGSAAEAQHFAAELVGRFKRDRAPYAVLSLATDTAILTAVANDYGYHDVFARQVRALGQPGDMLILFSTSGESENVVRAATAGRGRLMSVVAVAGAAPSRLARLSHVAVAVPATDTAAVQELHIVVTHILCDIAESELVRLDGGTA